MDLEKRARELFDEWSADLLIHKPKQALADLAASTYSTKPVHWAMTQLAREWAAAEVARVCEEKHGGHPLSIGDMLWWQGKRAMWTPQRNRISSELARSRGLRQGRDFDVVLERTSYSHEGEGWAG